MCSLNVPIARWETSIYFGLMHVFPSWLSSAVFYQIFPDRFRRSADYKAAGVFAPWGEKPTAHNFFGGNLRGVREGLDHIQELGANALYLCPIFSSTSNHRYHTNDYFRIDPLLGDEREFDNLVEEVHRRGMRIVLDGVFNHCSRGLYQFHSLLECGEESPFVDWFHVDAHPVNAYSGQNPNYRCWWNLPALPKFNTSNPEVREYLWRVGEYWIEKGIDGWRLDVPNEIDDDSFWQEFRRRIKSINPEAYIVGEIWDNPTRWLQGDQFDGVMNYPARKAIFEALTPEHESLRGDWAERLCAGLRDAFPLGRFGHPLNLLGSHDNRRIASYFHRHPQRLLQAWAILFFLPGSPCIFAGDELAQKGGKDPDNRRCFPWEKLALGKQTATWAHLRRLVELRQSHRALQDGSFSCEAMSWGVRMWREWEGQRVELQILDAHQDHCESLRILI